MLEVSQIGLGTGQDALMLSDVFGKFPTQASDQKFLTVCRTVLARFELYQKEVNISRLFVFFRAFCQ